MKYGLFSTEKTNGRSELIKNVMCKDGPTEEERQRFKQLMSQAGLLPFSEQSNDGEEKRPSLTNLQNRQPASTKEGSVFPVSDCSVN